MPVWEVGLGLRPLRAFAPWANISRGFGRLSMGYRNKGRCLLVESRLEEVGRKVHGGDIGLKECLKRHTIIRVRTKLLSHDVEVYSGCGLATHR
jgi:hypothetical protein